jgi:hypothetical protein
MDNLDHPRYQEFLDGFFNYLDAIEFNQRDVNFKLLAFNIWLKDN